MFMPLAKSIWEQVGALIVAHLKVIVLVFGAVAIAGYLVIRRGGRRANRRGRRGSARILAHPRDEEDDHDDYCDDGQHELIPTGKAYRAPVGRHHERRSEYAFKCRLCGYRTVIPADQLDEKQKAALQVLGLNLRVRSGRRRRRRHRRSTHRS